MRYFLHYNYNFKCRLSIAKKSIYGSVLFTVQIKIQVLLIARSQRMQNLSSGYDPSFPKKAVGSSGLAPRNH